MKALPIDPVAVSTARKTARPERPARDRDEGARGFEGQLRDAAKEPSRAGGDRARTSETATEPTPDPARGAEARPADPPPASEPFASRPTSEERPGRPRTRGPGSPAANPEGESLRQAALTAAGLGPRSPAPRPASGQVDEAGAAGPCGSGGGARGIVPTDDAADGSSVADDPRRPLHEVVNMIPGRKESVLPSAAAPLPGAASHGSPTVKTAPPVPAAAEELWLHPTAAVDGAGVDGAILRSAAHLRIEGVPGGLGDVELHLRVRGDVALLRVEGAGATAMGGRETELASALAAAGLSLGRLDLPPVAAATGAQMGSGGHRGGTDAGSGGSQASPQGQPESQERGTAHRPPEPREEIDQSGRNPARGARVHVEA